MANLVTVKTSLLKIFKANSIKEHSSKGRLKPLKPFFKYVFFNPRQPKICIHFTKLLKEFHSRTHVVDAVVVVDVVGGCGGGDDGDDDGRV